MHRHRPVRVRFPTTVDGIPCRVEARITPGYEPTLYDPGAPPDVEITVLDQRGRPAPWLERRLTRDDITRIETEALDEHRALSDAY